jgi:hypothetical protein
MKENFVDITDTILAVFIFKKQAVLASVTVNYNYQQNTYSPLSGYSFQIQWLRLLIFLIQNVFY